MGGTLACMILCRMLVAKIDESCGGSGYRGSLAHHVCAWGRGALIGKQQPPPPFWAQRAPGFAISKFTAPFIMEALGLRGDVKIRRSLPLLAASGCCGVTAFCRQLK